MVVSADVMNDAYKHESDAYVRERIQLVRSVRIDGKEAAAVAEKELYRTRGWAHSSDSCLEASPAAWSATLYARYLW